MRQLSLWVGVHAGGFNGIDTYAEQMARAAATAGHQVTLLATDALVARTLQSRFDDQDPEPRVKVDHLGLEPLTARGALLERLWPTAAVHRQLAALRGFAAREQLRGAIWHFNRPALALAVRGQAERIVVAAWFHPHRPLGRVQETWRHVGGSPLRRAIISAKALDFYRWDQRGYRASDWIVSPTTRLAVQLRAQGLRVVTCPPPARAPPESLVRVEAATEPNRGLRFVVCSGDLAHPRKNLLEAIDALGELTRRRGPVTLVAIGRNPEPLVQRARQSAPLLRIETAGVLEPSQVRERMQGCDALLFPSRYEEWGYVAVEALLCGIPVVTYSVYPFDEMLAGGLGSVATGQRTEDYAEAIERSLLLPRNRELSRAAAARFGGAAVAERLCPIWAGTSSPG